MQTTAYDVSPRTNKKPGNSVIVKSFGAMQTVFEYMNVYEVI